MKITIKIKEDCSVVLDDISLDGSSDVLRYSGQADAISRMIEKAADSVIKMYEERRKDGDS